MSKHILHDTSGKAPYIIYCEKRATGRAAWPSSKSVLRLLKISIVFVNGTDFLTASTDTQAFLF